MNKYDVIIIGWGKGGKTLAAKLSAHGKKIAIIEKDPKMFGGTCINIGCLPTKALVHSAKVENQARKLDVKLPWIKKEQYYQAAMKHKRDFVKLLNKKNFNVLDSKPNVDTYIGEASFLSQHEVVIGNGKKQEVIYGDKIVINTGARSRLLEGVKIKSHKVLYSTGMLDLTELPKKLLVIGSGFIGLEFASMYANFGSKVTVLSPHDSFLPSEDKSDADEVKKALEAQRIIFITNANLTLIKDYAKGTKVQAEVDGQEWEDYFDAILVAIGRIPNVEGLNLKSAGVEMQNGAIKVDENLKTTTNNIWAVGDCKGGAFFTYISLDDSRIVLPQLLDQNNDRTTNNRPVVPWSMFIDPAYARVGLNEKEADKQGIKYEVRRLATAAMPKAHVINETRGFNKILVDEKGYIIGATLFNYEAAEMINIISLAMVYKIKFMDLKNFIYTHPIFIENLNEF
ncbi:dihydrolipoyl dehydrogenase family protein [Mycoplasmopsis verecunda]|uniref:Pyruvate/2-oxoglutarate dehydrogenase complex, dihydrolipoamide dehydrogenase (E3) component n=1 Tax=Mycoplasmopsis verecunda TaxID=171291 RepID=A0A1T4L6C2_9BACT|nr:NAD(P)/FAD-dependent oxidoreductase [Mycoplasmopsis verecunda]WPB54783.1 NAD(P)/FAD-dependent oxidoreductase [Mycoplasmopsis verecunda]SJZ50255.1 Pyruvate/2-oxoglutarate dehydrogenase complex, dihydrolipoamide dehydrogenase (E3) component [Mycoplasmopsis verecunda]